MKKILSSTHAVVVLSFLVGISLLSSCSDEYTGEYEATVNPLYLNVDKTVLACPSYGSQQTFGVHSMGTTWQIANSAPWININPLSGDASATIAVDVTENNEYSASGRAAVITVEASDVNSRMITVNQESPALRLEVTPTAINLSGKADNATVKVDSNTDWTFAITDDSWLTATKTSMGLNLTAKENSTGAGRTSYISIASESKTAQVIVTQQAAGISITPTDLDFSYQSETKTISVLSEAAWKAKTNTAWLSINPESGNAGNNQITVKVSENASLTERVGSFTIDNKAISVHQGAVVLDATPLSLNFAEIGETLVLSINSNTSWTIEKATPASWLTISKTQGTGNAEASLTAQKNNESVRGVVLTLKTGNGISKTLMVTQNGGGLETVSNLSAFDKNGGKIDLSPIQPSNWTATVEDGVTWIHVSPTSGSSSTRLMITVDKNDGLNDRSSYILINYANGKRYKVLINQYGMGLTVNTSQYSFMQQGGSSEAIEVKSNGTVNVSVTGDSGISASLSGNILIIRATENFFSFARQATVTLALAGTDIKHEIAVVQAGQNGQFTVYGYDTDQYISLSAPTDSHEAVDLGLSVKWATCNVGASKPEDYGDYYAWGETETKNIYNWSTYKWCNGSETTMTKYCTSSSYGTVDNKTTLDPEDDVAHVKWGGSWRMPTTDEQDELRNSNSCIWTWTTLNGVDGYKVTSKINGNSIFLPAAGYKSSPYGADYGGLYWSSSLHGKYSDFAYDITFYSDNVGWGASYRYDGKSVRPVCP